MRARKRGRLWLPEGLPTAPLAGIFTLVVRRFLACFVLGLFAALCSAERILLIPLDSRPAAGQFAQMIGAFAGVEVRLPPYESLGRFTQPGNPEVILDWLNNQDFSDVVAVVVSADMIAYGGLIPSRIYETGEAEAMARLRKLQEIRNKAPNVPFYGYSAIMRLNPTATRATAAWRLQLGRYAEVQDRYRATKAPELKQTLRSLEAKIPALEIKRYDRTRQRNHTIQKSLIQQVAQGTFDYMLFGQDDAKPNGPHVGETSDLRSFATGLGLLNKVQFAEGVDQHANVLVSRALLKREGWTPRIRIEYSDPTGKRKVADYETKSIEKSLEDQIFASGARPAMAGQEYDYTLYVNTPGRRESVFRDFLTNLLDEVDQGFPVSVADINLAKDGTSDPELFESLNEASRMIRLLSYAGWNTAGNTLGTSIPAANVYLLSRRRQSGHLEREIALREFLLHRFVNDYAYHKYVRPLAYRMIDETPSASREETYGSAFDDVNAFVGTRLGELLQTIFTTQFLGKTFFAGSKKYEIATLEDVRIFLPWPRAYEVRLEFHLAAKAVESSASGTGKAVQSDLHDLRRLSRYREDDRFPIDSLRWVAHTASASGGGDYAGMGAPGGEFDGPGAEPQTLWRAFLRGVSLRRFNPSSALAQFPVHRLPGGVEHL